MSDVVLAGFSKIFHLILVAILRRNCLEMSVLFNFIFYFSDALVVHIVQLFWIHDGCHLYLPRKIMIRSLRDYFLQVMHTWNSH